MRWARRRGWWRERKGGSTGRRRAGRGISWFLWWTIEGWAYLDVEEDPDVFEPRLGEVLEQVREEGEGFVGLLRGPQGAKVAPVAVGNLFINAKGALEGGILAAVSIAVKG